MRWQLRNRRRADPCNAWRPRILALLWWLDPLLRLLGLPLLRSTPENRLALDEHALMLGVGICTFVRQ